ncbi:hypothetical protein [Prevotella sp. 10(H)]|uniref:hypothetical protein n=1 Tax=Prevotella sp. 10(H) TaxID=1158294 RepID=UPI0012DD3F70|nr:hypothetical protein [Prevotella sp. 10(H)]
METPYIIIIALSVIIVALTVRIVFYHRRVNKMRKTIAFLLHENTHLKYYPDKQTNPK